MSRLLHVLLVEDCNADAELIVAELKAHGYAPDCRRVQTEPEFLAQLGGGSWDVVIADYRLPRFSAMRALEIVQARRVDLPFIIVSGTIGEEVAVAAMKAGAHDYVMKGKLARLVPAVERELREAEVRRARARRTGGPLPGAPAAGRGAGGAGDRCRRADYLLESGRRAALRLARRRS